MVIICVLFFLVSNLHLGVSSEGKPEFLPSAERVVAVKGLKAVLPCRVQGLGPSHRVIWSFQRVLLTLDKRRISSDPRLSLEQQYLGEWNLVINGVDLEDSGTYSCQINTVPLSSKEVELYVLNEQPFPVLPEQVLALSGGSAEIPCKLPDINDIGVWSHKVDEKSEKGLLTEKDRVSFKTGQGHDSHVHTLVISDVRSGDEGQYFCRARSGTEAATRLIVVVPPQPPALAAKAESPNRLQVRWKRPPTQHAELAGYKLYVHDHDTGKESVFDVPPSGSKEEEEEEEEESFTVDDLTTHTKYTLQLASKLQMGSEVTVGKRSPEVNISTPMFIPEAPGWVKVKRLSDEEAEVHWSPPPEADTRGIIRGYTVTYAPINLKTKEAGKSSSIRVDKRDGKTWSAILPDLKIRRRYEIRVAGFTRKGDGRLSKPVIYLHKALPPELSLNGRVLSDNSVLLTVSVLGNDKLTNVKMYYTEATHPSWKDLDFQPEWKFTVVGGLDPGSSYFFKVGGKVGGKTKQSVTHIFTPPHELQTPQAVEVSATASTSIQVTWDYIIANQSAFSLPLGYMVHLEETRGGEEKGKKHRQSVVFNRTSVEVKDLNPGMRYNIQVSAFNGFGEGPRTDGILFHIAETDVKPDAANEPFPPRFAHELPQRITVQKGEVVKITCVAEGNPVPEVRWYDGQEPIGVAAQGSNQLYLANVQRSTVLTCKATSEWGEIDASTQVTLADEKDEAYDTAEEPESDTALDMFVTDVTESSANIKWNQTVCKRTGELIDRYHIEILDKNDNVLLSTAMPTKSMLFNLRDLQPATSYRAVVRAFGKNDVPLGDAKLAFTTLNAGVTPSTTTTLRTTRTTTKTPVNDNKEDIEAPAVVQDDSYRARIGLTLHNLTSTSAQLQWQFLGLDPRYVQLFDLKVKSRTNFTLLTESFRPNLNEITLNLQPGDLYFVQVRAFDRRGEVLALSTMRVHTPTAAVLQQPEETEETEDGAGDEDDEEPPVLKRATVTLTSHAVTGDSARLDWSLSGVNPADIGQFVMKVTDLESRPLLRQEMRPESRSLTLSNLTPSTQYLLELSALDDKGSTIATSTAALTTTTATSTEELDDSSKFRVFTEELTTGVAKIAWYTPPKILPDLSGISVTLTDIANVTLLTQQMSPLTRSLTVRNLQPGERYRAQVELKGSRGEVVRSGHLEFDTEPEPGMPGRPTIVRVLAANSSAVRIDWRNTPSPSPAAGADDITGYVINFAEVDAQDQPSQGVFQVPVFGTINFVVIPNLNGGRRYLFQVAARNQYSFGPLSVPVFVDTPAG